MPDMSNFLAWGGKAGDYLDDIARSSLTSQLLGYVGVEITIVRGSTTLDPQTVIIAHEQSQRDAISGDAGQGGEFFSAVVGTPTLDIKIGDMFLYNGVRYQVLHVLKDIDGRIKARAKQVQ